MTERLRGIDRDDALIYAHAAVARLRSTAVTDWFRVTVEDLQTGEKQVTDVAAGDFVVNTFGDCYLNTVQSYAGGTVQIFIKGHQPTAKARPVDAGETGA